MPRRRHDYETLNLDGLPALRELVAGDCGIKREFQLMIEIELRELVRKERLAAVEEWLERSSGGTPDGLPFLDELRLTANRTAFEHRTPHERQAVGLYAEVCELVKREREDAFRKGQFAGQYSESERARALQRLPAWAKSVMIAARELHDNHQGSGSVLTRIVAKLVRRFAALTDEQKAEVNRHG